MKQITFLLSCVLTFQVAAFAEPAKNLASYDELKHQVRETFVRGKERAADAVERERVRTNWEVGKLIDEHILLHKERAQYGDQVIKRLSNDLGVGARELHYMVEFARAYPIVTHASQLTWSDYRDLLAVNDDKKRNVLTEQAAKNKWSRATLRNEIKKIKADNPNAVKDDLIEEFIPIKGKLNTYRIVPTFPENLRIDLGFSNYLEIPKKYKSKFKQGDIVQSENGKLKLLKNGTQADLFTYKARVLEITDGDTLWLLVDLGFGISTRQQVRLRGIDTPEIATRDGQAAKAFVESQLEIGSEIIMTTAKSDKYDRYLADIFYETKSGEHFLNGELLKERLAHQI